MLRQAVATWWLLQLRGILAFAFGVCLFFLAGIMQGRFTTSLALVCVFLTFSCYLLASGALFIFGAIRSFGVRARAWATAGTTRVALGVWLFVSERLTRAWLVWFTVAAALASGVAEIAFSRAFKRHAEALFLVVAGSVSVAVSVLLIIGSDAQFSSLVSILGMYALFYGTVLVMFSLRLRVVRKHMHRLHPI